MNSGLLIPAGCFLPGAIETDSIRLYASLIIFFIFFFYNFTGDVLNPSKPMPIRWISAVEKVFCLVIPLSHKNGMG